MTLLLLIYTIKQFYQRAAARAHDLTALRIWQQGRRRLGDRGDNAGAGGAAASSRGSSLVCLAQMPKNGEESPRFPVLCY